MSSFPDRVGALAGWTSLLGVVVVLVILPTAIAGQPVTGTIDPGAIRAYFSHPELAFSLAYVNALIVVAIVPFALALRRNLGSTQRAEFFANVGLVAIVVTAGLYLIQGALAAALITAVAGGFDVVPVFRFYDVLYNGVADIWEGLWIGSFSAAILSGGSVFPRWVGWLGISLGALRWIKALGPFAAIPPALALISGVVFFLWFAMADVGLTRIGWPRQRQDLPASEA